MTINWLLMAAKFFISLNHFFRFLQIRIISSTNIRASSSCTEHIHEYIELNFVYSGQCGQTINNKDVLLKKGDIVLIDTDIPHSIAKTGEDDIIINLIINQNFFSKCLSQIAATKSYLSQFLLQAISDTQKHNQYLIFRNTNTEKISLLFQQLLCEVYEPGIGTKEMQLFTSN